MAPQFFPLYNLLFNSSLKFNYSFFKIILKLIYPQTFHKIVDKIDKSVSEILLKVRTF